LRGFASGQVASMTYPPVLEFGTWEEKGTRFRVWSSVFGVERSSFWSLGGKKEQGSGFGVEWSSLNPRDDQQKLAKAVSTSNEENRARFTAKSDLRPIFQGTTNLI
jgi:hypothetical protein